MRAALRVRPHHAGRPARPRGGRRRVRRRVRARRAGRRHLGRVGRPGEDDSLGARHDHQRLVDHQDDDVPLHADAARPRRARFPRPRRNVLARVRAGRQGEDRGPPHHGPHRRPLGLGGADGQRGPGGLGPLHRTPGGAGTVVGAGDGERLPRRDAGVPDRRDPPAHHRREHRRLVRPRGGQAARGGLLHRAAGQRGPPRLRRHPAAAHRLRSHGGSGQRADGQDIPQPPARCGAGASRVVAPGRDPRRQRPGQRPLGRRRPVDHRRQGRGPRRPAAFRGRHRRHLRGPSGGRRPGPGRPRTHGHGVRTEQPTGNAGWPAHLLLGRLRRLGHHHGPGRGADRLLRDEPYGVRPGRRPPRRQRRGGGRHQPPLRNYERPAPVPAPAPAVDAPSAAGRYVVVCAWRAPRRATTPATMRSASGAGNLAASVETFRIISPR